MYQLEITNKFRRDLRRCQKQGKDMIKFKIISQLLEQGKVLPVHNRDHNLTGNWRGYRECHLLPDWLLIYEIDEVAKIITFDRMGSHAELFG
jgi:mRNA interferase YafQ